MPKAGSAMQGQATAACGMQPTANAVEPSGMIDLNSSDSGAGTGAPHGGTDPAVAALPFVANAATVKGQPDMKQPPGSGANLSVTVQAPEPTSSPNSQSTEPRDKQHQVRPATICCSIVFPCWALACRALLRMLRLLAPAGTDGTKCIAAV